jgi:glyoxylase-like metal-dependent hydrolase (beta-lactamase superfamily II)
MGDEPSRETCRVNVGDFECLVVLDCMHEYKDPAKAMFSGGTPEQVNAFLASQGVDAASWKVYTSPYPCMVVCTGESTVLLDAGAGDFGRQASGRPGRVLANLEQEGLGPEEIDTVILTHGHPDHIGGVLTETGEPRFRRARHVMDRREWDYWMGPSCEESSPADLVVLARRFLSPLNGMVELTDGDTEVTRGVRVRAAYGHTPGHLCVELSSRDEKLTYVSDLFLLSYHLQCPQWCFKGEFDRAQSFATRRAFLGELAEQHALVQAFHLPFPGLGHVVADGDAWKWQPMR